MNEEYKLELEQNFFGNITKTTELFAKLKSPDKELLTYSLEALTNTFEFKQELLISSLEALTSISEFKRSGVHKDKAYSFEPEKAKIYRTVFTDMSQKDLALFLGSENPEVGVSLISQYERGVRTPTSDRSPFSKKYLEWLSNECYKEKVEIHLNMKEALAGK